MKLIILDRDGVINHDSPDYVKTPEEWQPLDGSLEAISRLHHANWRIVIASNQSAIGRELMTLEQLYQIHKKMQGLLAELGAWAEALFFCPHKPTASCACRKPKPGLLLDIARRFHTDLTGVPFIGDSWKDVQAAEKVGATPYLVLTGKGKQTCRDNDVGDVEVHNNLLAVAETLLNRESINNLSAVNFPNH